MPIYEYRCGQGHTFEVIQRISDDPVATCQTCEAPVERVYHPVAVHFKGSGFYNTDYGTRKRQRENGESGDGGSSDSGEKKGDSAKPDTGKADAKKSDKGPQKADSKAPA
jgi:putative FmdB family regulatory protein